MRHLTIAVMLLAAAAAGCSSSGDSESSPFDAVFAQLAEVELGCQAPPDQGQRRFGDVLALSATCTTVVDDTDVDLTVILDEDETLQRVVDSLDQRTFVTGNGVVVVLDTGDTGLAELAAGLVGDAIGGQVVAYDDSGRFCEVMEEFVDLAEQAAALGPDSSQADFALLQQQVEELVVEAEEVAPAEIADLLDSPDDADLVTDYVQEQCGVELPQF